MFSNDFNKCILPLILLRQATCYTSEQIWKEDTKSLAFRDWNQCTRLGILFSILPSIFVSWVPEYYIVVPELETVEREKRSNHKLCTKCILQQIAVVVKLICANALALSFVLKNIYTKFPRITVIHCICIWNAVNRQPISNWASHMQPFFIDHHITYFFIVVSFFFLSLSLM